MTTRQNPSAQAMAIASMPERKRLAASTQSRFAVGRLREEFLAERAMRTQVMHDRLRSCSFTPGRWLASWFHTRLMVF
jgi:hypothetical protein